MKNETATARCDCFVHRAPFPEWRIACALTSCIERSTRIVTNTRRPLEMTREARELRSVRQSEGKPAVNHECEFCFVGTAIRFIEVRLIEVCFFRAPRSAGR